MAKKRNLKVVVTAQSTPTPVGPKPRNHFAIVLDVSGSMQGLSTAATKAVNGILAAIKNGAATFNQETTVSLYTFSNTPHRMYYRVPADQVQMMHVPYCGGGTALFDAVGMSIDDFRNDLSDANDPNTSYVIIAVTDGEENSSSKYLANNSAYRTSYWRTQPGSKLFVDLLKEVQATDRYTITFQVPPGYGHSLARGYGIPVGNIREWEQTEAGVREVERSASVGTQSYFNSRSLGLKSVDSFYVKTDLSNLKKSDLKKLVDQSSRFKAWTVDKETDVKSFVESHGKKFVIGSVFYALTKKEKVQPQKAVLIQEKGNKAVYAGQEARDLIGLPQGANATVEPGNHANYDIYVQSTSVNRKLVRGTKVLFDTSLAVDLTPTWDHVAAKAAADAKKANQNP